MDRTILAVMLIAIVMVATSAPSGAERSGAGRGPKPTPTPAATPTPAPPPTAEPTTSPTGSPVPTATPSGNPVAYADGYWALLQFFPNGWANNACVVAATLAGGGVCEDIISPVYLHPDGTWGSCPWKVDPLSPAGWSVDFAQCVVESEGF